jgi:hypothetical protein
MKTESRTGRAGSNGPASQSITTTKAGRVARAALVGATTTTEAGAVSFSVVRRAVAAQFEKMKQYQLFRVDLTGPQGALMSAEMRRSATGDRLWEAYLAAFPPGANPLYKERTEHDCQCCKSFIRQMGGVVAVVNGMRVSIWDFAESGLGFYSDVAQRMSDLVDTGVIDTVFLHTEKSVGVEKNFQQLVELSDPKTGIRLPTTTLAWEHFHLHLPAACVVKSDVVGPRQADARAAHDVLKRGLEELTMEAVDTVLELIAQNSLYRGEEHKAAVAEFRRLKAEYDYFDNPEFPGYEASQAQHYFIWSNIGSFAARIRNTAIGTLLQDLSGSPARTYQPGECVSTICAHRPFRHEHQGARALDLDEAVGRFEKVMAPANYKRPTALVTKAMVERARAKVEELGLTSALERRHAVLEDITVNDILFVDRAAKTVPATGDDAFAALATAVPEGGKSLDRVEEVPVDKFLADILPRARSLEVLLENCHMGNLVSLVAPADPGAKNMFKWLNGFSWSYAGEVADSVKERVKRAGGSVVGDLCCRLAWDYTDDLDFHMQEPGGGGRIPTGFLTSSGRGQGWGAVAASNHIYYDNVRRLSANGGMLDLDANGCDGMKAEPVENIFYADRRKMREGEYKLYVHNYNRRSTGAGFEAEVEFDGQTVRFSYAKVLRTGDHVEVATITHANGAFTVASKLSSSQAVKTVWGLTTWSFHKVNAVMLSPNWWYADNTNSDIERSLRSGIGNKHWFFMLENCRNADGARGFYNEFLSAELEPHRKTMEMVGAKMRAENSDRQLSGLGFSSTKRDSLTVRVKGSFNRVVKVVF